MKYALLICFIFCGAFSICAQDTIAYTSATSGLKMRSGATLSSKVVAVIPYQAQVEVLEILKNAGPLNIQGRVGYWCKIKWKKTTGYVFGGFLELAPGIELLRELPRSWTKIKLPVPGDDDICITEYDDNYTERMSIFVDMEYNYSYDALPNNIMSNDKPPVILLAEFPKRITKLQVTRVEKEGKRYKISVIQNNSKKTYYIEYYKPHIIVFFGKHVNNFYIAMEYEGEARIHKWSP
ncbi:MAG: SH3 domain-containing protein [Spirochaetia bacterium]